jgi:general secretion pathway protein I
MGGLRHRERSPSASRGFTLVEVLVAFIITGLALAALFRGGVDGLFASRLAERTQLAVARAQSRLTAACSGTQLAPGTRSGDDGGGFAWRTRVLVAAATTVPRGTDDEPKPPLRATLYAVEVDVSWGAAAAARHVSLATSCVSLSASGAPVASGAS